MPITIALCRTHGDDCEAILAAFYASGYPFYDYCMSRKLFINNYNFQPPILRILDHNNITIDDKYAIFQYICTIGRLLPLKNLYCRAIINKWIARHDHLITVLSFITASGSYGIILDYHSYHHYEKWVRKTYIKDILNDLQIELNQSYWLGGLSNMSPADILWCISLSRLFDEHGFLARTRLPTTIREYKQRCELRIYSQLNF